MGTLPRLIVRNKAYHDMIHQTQIFPDRETAWAIYGFLLPDTRVYLAGIIPPLDETEIKRNYATTSFGGKRTLEALLWLEKDVRYLGIPPEQAKFAFLGKGHSHHRLDVFAYSPIDNETIRSHIESGGMALSIGPLSYITDPARKKVDIKFYFYSREMWQKRVMKPEVLPFVLEDTLPEREKPNLPLPRLGWQFFSKPLYDREISEIKARGYQLSLQENQPPHIRFLVSKPEWNDGMIIIRTEFNFPDTPPLIEIFPNDERGKVDASHLWKKKNLFADIIVRIDDATVFSGGELPEG